MEAFYSLHRSLIGRERDHIHREVVRRINPNDQLTIIRGSRGLGKTSLLIDYAQHYWEGNLEECLYVSLNELYFSANTLIDFIDKFVSRGGKLLLLDQIFKYPSWQEHLLLACRRYSGLRMICTCSSVLTNDEILEALPDLQVNIIPLYGFSFREFLKYHHKVDFPVITLEELLTTPSKVVSQFPAHNLDLAETFMTYLQQGYYPPELEGPLFKDMLMKNLNMLLEIDVVYLRQVDPSYLPKLRQMLHALFSNRSTYINVKNICESVNISRPTVTNYLKYLSDAGFYYSLYKVENATNQEQKKPDRIVLSNPNIVYALTSEDVNYKELYRSFLVSQLYGAGVKVLVSPIQWGDFLCGDRYNLKVADYLSKRERTELIAVAPDLFEYTSGDYRIPLWFFGLLY